MAAPSPRLPRHELEHEPFAPLAGSQLRSARAGSRWELGAPRRLTRSCSSTTSPGRAAAPGKRGMRLLSPFLPLNRVAAACKLLPGSWCYSDRKNDKVVIVLRAGSWNPTPAADAAGCAGTASTPESPAAVDIKACVAHGMRAVHENLNFKRLNKYMGGAGRARGEQPRPLARRGDEVQNCWRWLPGKTRLLVGWPGVLPKHVLRPPGGASCPFGVCCKPDAVCVPAAITAYLLHSHLHAGREPGAGGGYCRRTAAVTGTCTLKQAVRARLGEDLHWQAREPQVAREDTRLQSRGMRGKPRQTLPAPQYSACTSSPTLASAMDT